MMDRDNERQRAIVLNIFRASNLLERLGRQMAAKAGLTSVQQWFILGALSGSKDGGLSLTELRQNTLVTKQCMTGMVERLRQSGHVTAAPDRNDRRITRVSLTDKGRETLVQLRQSSLESNVRTFQSFSRRQMEEMDGLTAQLVRDLMEQLGE